MPELYTHGLDDLLTMYRETCSWFSELGFECAATRYGTYERHFTRFVSAATSPDGTSIDMEFKRAFDSAYLEANEIIRVYSDLKHFEKTQFLDQLKKVLSGQEFRAQTDNDQARDFMFELSTAARFLRAGFPVTLSGVCDVVAELPQGRLFIECKRVKSPNRIAKNVKKAAEQIKSRMSKYLSKKSMGLIAINVTDLIDSPRYLAPDSPRAAAAVHRTLANTFLANHLEEFKPRSTSNRMLGVMIENSSMWYFSERCPVSGLAYTRHTNFIQLAQPEILGTLAPKLSNQDIVR
jgi:hypothetical protein